MISQVQIRPVLFQIHLSLLKSMFPMMRKIISPRFQPIRVLQIFRSQRILQILQMAYLRLVPLIVLKIVKNH